MLDNVVKITCIRLVFSYIGSGIDLLSYRSDTVRCNKEIATDTMQPGATECVAEVTEHWGDVVFIYQSCTSRELSYVSWTKNSFISY